MVQVNCAPRTKTRQNHRYDESVKPATLYHIEIPLEWCMGNPAMLEEWRTEDDDEQIQYKEINKKRLFSQLIARVYELCEEHLTEHQKVVLNIWRQGTPALQIAKKLGLNYTTIPHCIYGIHTIRADGTVRYMGGVIPKLQRLVANDEKCLMILTEIRQMDIEI